jgi:LmbE family N-acetylglucosaminyl deacetylase
VSTIDTAPLGTIMGIWAHPDDEAFLSAGLMAAAVAAGQRVVVVTATFGERGTSDPVRWPPDRLARLRRDEMAASLAAVGVREHHWLGYRDGGCADVPTASAVARIGRIVDEVRPDTILTFGPDGMTGHPDHVTVSAWTTAVWQARWRAPRLCYATLLPAFHERWADLNAEVGIFGPGVDPPCTPDDEAAAIVACQGSVLDAKIAALRAHASQTAPLVARAGVATFRRWWSVEAFVDAVPARALTGSRR